MCHEPADIDSQKHPGSKTVSDIIKDTGKIKHEAQDDLNNIVKIIDIYAEMRNQDTK